MSDKGESVSPSPCSKLELGYENADLLLSPCHTDGDTGTAAEHQDSGKACGTGIYLIEWFTFGDYHRVIPLVEPVPQVRRPEPVADWASTR